jgi:hypothetical protein
MRFVREKETNMDTNSERDTDIWRSATQYEAHGIGKREFKIKLPFLDQ